jgi:hypothetical protein
MKVGVWNGGLGPHQPFHSGSSCDPRSEQPQEGVVDAAATAELADPLAPPPGGEHPVVQPFAGVTERCVEALTLTGGETVERDGDLLDADE